MRKKLFTLAVLTLVLINTVHSQTHGPRYRHFLANPYLFNPAYVGINEQKEASVVYRQQWVNFKDAPVLAGFNLQLPTNNRVAFGFNLTSEKQVLLRNSSFMATFGYIVPLGEKQSLRFGLSGGIGMNSLDLNAEELNSNDPALRNATDNNFYVDGNVGLVYAHSGFKFGFAFTEIFNSNSFNQETFNKFSLSNLKNRLYSMSYRFNVGIMENFAVEPYVLYRQSTDGLQDAWEAASLIYFKDKIWTGAGYNQNNGLALFLGMNVKEKFKFNYSYEFPPFKSGVTATSAHELHLSVKFGKKKSNSIVKNKPKPAYTKPANEVVETDIEKTDSIETAGTQNKIAKQGATDKNVKTTVPQNKQPDANVKKNPENIKISKETSPKPNAPKTTPGRPAKSFTISKGHYVVVAVFSMMDHSTKFTKQLIREGYNVNVALNPKNKFYYVYIFSSYDIEEARKIRNQYRWKNLFKEAWVFTMD